MCKYCNYTADDGWAQLVEYDDVYQTAMEERAERRSNYGFYEEWDDLREQVVRGV
ncbi:hypothetical protein [Candidatus Halobonum tyrrellensis]|uniref:Uncharacterized protein n=1 Tax=Candidatus Halobonum tyrrellensis G22 TaxID=1324957 RepID=V4HCE2_9EURY|nr:hypothetical protein [Candidatus Halobonum tyrrellensis]ESP87728.1 hypothetical protein K933_12595 [Candidatus Halobonum tyrrellensis G22]